MNPRSLYLLVFIVGCVGWIVLWQDAREDRGDFDVSRPLFEEVEFERISRIQISSITNGSDFTLQRNSGGFWYLTDPVAYRANEGLIALLRQAIEGNLALRPPDPTAVHSAIGLAPPESEIVLTEVVDGLEIRHRLTLGMPDATGNRVYALQDGELLLTSRNISNTLGRDFTEFRSRRISQIDPAKVIQVHRSGRVQHAIEDDPYDLEFSAFRDGATWRSLRPIEASLDPIEVSHVVIPAGRLSFDVYVEEPNPDLSVYGLSEPEFRVELNGHGGASEVLFLGRPGVGGGWFCMRGGSDDVYRVDSREAILMTKPFESMIDRRLVRVAAEDVSAIRLERTGGLIKLERGGSGWLVSDGASAPVAAEPLAVRSLLAWVAAEELEPFDDYIPVTGEMNLDQGLVLEVNGIELGGEVGGKVPSEGPEVFWYRRIGDQHAGKIDSEILYWLERPVGTWWSLSLLEIDELEVSSLLIAEGERERRYARGSKGIWRDEAGAEAVELLPLLDPLLFLRATDRVIETQEVEMRDPILVRFELHAGGVKSFTIGLNDGGTAECLVGSVRAALLRGDLHEGLRSLLP